MNELNGKQKRILNEEAASAMAPDFSSDNKEIEDILCDIYLDEFGRDVKQKEQGYLMAQEISAGVSRFARIYDAAVPLPEKEELLKKLKEEITAEGLADDADDEALRQAAEDMEEQIRASFFKEMEMQGKEGAPGAAQNECLIAAETYEKYEKKVAVRAMLLYCKIKTGDPDFADFPLFLTADQVVAIVYEQAEKERLLNEQRDKKIHPALEKVLLGALAFAVSALFLGAASSLILFGVAGTVRLAQSVWGKEEVPAQEKPGEVRQQDEIMIEAEEVSGECEKVSGKCEETSAGYEKISS